MSKKTILAGLLPFLSNPTTLAVVAIGAVGFTVYDILFGEKAGQDNGSKTLPNGSTPLIEPLDNPELTVDATVIEPFETIETTVGRTVHSTAQEPICGTFDEGIKGTSPAENSDTEEVLKMEMIRQAMSELGKRSAAARAKRKVSS